MEQKMNGNNQESGSYGPYDYGQYDYSQSDCSQSDYGQYDYGQSDSGPYDYGQYDYGQYGADYYAADYYDGPYDRKGRPVRNRFGRKLALSIVETLFVLPLGVLGIIFTCLQNSAYQRREWDRFITYKKTSNAMIGVGYGLLGAGIAGIAALIAIETNIRKPTHVIEEEPVIETQVTPEGMYEFTADGIEFRCGERLSDFMERTGVSFDTDPTQIVLQPTASENLYLSPVNNYVCVYNAADEALTADACTVLGAGLSFPEGETHAFSYMGSLTEESRMMEWIGVLGNCSYDFSETSQYRTCEWNTDEGFVTCDFAGGTLTDFRCYFWGGKIE